MLEVTHILKNNTPNTTMDDPNLELYTFILDLFWINLKLLDFVLGSVIWFLLKNEKPQWSKQGLMIVYFQDTMFINVYNTYTY